MASLRRTIPDRQRLSVCGICWNASNHRPRPELTTKGPDKEGKCSKCKQTWRTANLLFLAQRRKWIEVRPRPAGVSSAFKLCEYARRKDLSSCPNRNKCTFAHSTEELEEWQRERDKEHASRIRKPDMGRSKLCVYYINGRCIKDNCTFAHEFRPCDRQFNGSGFCSRDAACSFAHSDKELAAWNNWLSRSPMSQQSSANAADAPGSRGAAGATAPANAAARRFWCEDCQVACESGRLLQTHFTSEGHVATMRARTRQREMSSREPKHRPPPRNVFGEYRMCRFVASGRRCDFGDSACTFAHSDAELASWRCQRTGGKGKTAGGDGTGNGSPRVEGRDTRSVAAQVIDSLIDGSVLFTSMCGPLAYASVEEASGQPLNVERDTFQAITWTFKVTAVVPLTLTGITLLDGTVPEFCLAEVKTSTGSALLKESSTETPLDISMAVEEWVTVTVEMLPLQVGFFEQTLVVRFNKGACARRLSVALLPSEETQVCQEHTRETVAAMAEFAPGPRFSLAEGQGTVVFRQAAVVARSDRHALPEEFKALLTRGTDVDAFSTMPSGLDSPSQFKKYLHHLLYLAETTRTRELASLALAKASFVPVVSAALKRGDAHPIMAADEHLFRLLPQGASLYLSGILRPRDVCHVLTASGERHEAVVASVADGSVVVAVGRKTSSALTADGSSISFDGTAWREFQPLHSALDAADPDVVFPSPIKGQAKKSHQATAGQDADQDAVAARVCGEGGGLLVVHGLPGSGKTHALVGAAAAASTTNRSRMLICCDTDVDADRFTLQLLSARGTGKRRPSVFRLFHPHAIQGLPLPEAPKFSSNRAQDGRFHFLTSAVLDWRVVVTTFEGAHLLKAAGVKAGHFRHIFLDDADRCPVVRAFLALQFVTPATKVTLAGSHVATDRHLRPATTEPLQDLDTTIIEVLSRRDGWMAGQQGCVTLSRSYRCGGELLQLSGRAFPSTPIGGIFADWPVSSKVLERSLQPEGSASTLASCFPVSFVSVRGKERHIGSYSYNDYEAVVLARQVAKLAADWPPAWPPLAPGDVCVLAPNALQAARLRVTLAAQGQASVPVITYAEAHNNACRVALVSTVVDRWSAGRAREGAANARAVAPVLTRPSELLVVVGSAGALLAAEEASVPGTQRRVWGELLQHCRSKGTFVSDGTDLDAAVALHRKLTPLLQIESEKVHLDLAAAPALSQTAGTQQLPSTAAVMGTSPAHTGLPWGDLLDGARLRRGSIGSVESDLSSWNGDFGGLSLALDHSRPTSQAAASSTGYSSGGQSPAIQLGMPFGTAMTSLPSSSAAAAPLQPQPIGHRAGGDLGASLEQRARALVAKLVPAIFVPQVVENLARSCSDAGGLEALLLNREAAAYRVRDLFQTLVMAGARPRSYSQSSLSSVGSSHASQRSAGGPHQDFLEAQNAALMEHTSFCQQQLRDPTLPRHVSQSLRAQLKVLEQQWALLNQQRNLISGGSPAALSMPSSVSAAAPAALAQPSSPSTLSSSVGGGSGGHWPLSSSPLAVSPSLGASAAHGQLGGWGGAGASAAGSSAWSTGSNSSAVSSGWGQPASALGSPGSSLDNTAPRMGLPTSSFSPSATPFVPPSAAASPHLPPQSPTAVAARGSGSPAVDLTTAPFPSTGDGAAGAFSNMGSASDPLAAPWHAAGIGGNEGSPGPQRSRFDFTLPPS